MEHQNFHYKSRLFIFSIIVLLILLIIPISITFYICFTRFSWSSRFRHIKNHNRPYKLSLYEPENDILTSVGFVEGFELEEDGFYTYEGVDGEIFLISDLEAKEFVCEGECSCVRDGNLRRNGALSTIFKRSTTFLIAASAVFLANKMSNNYISEVCDKMISEECNIPSNTIESRVIECKANERMEMSMDVYSEETEETMEEYATKLSKLTLPHTYLCKGGCIPIDFDSRMHKYLKEEREMVEQGRKVMLEGYDCSKHTLSKEITVYGTKEFEEKFLYVVKQNNLDFRNPEDSLSFNPIVDELSEYESINEFIQDFQPFCAMSSEIEMTGKFYGKKFSICTGVDEDFNESVNNVRCLRMNTGGDIFAPLENLDQLSDL